MNPKSTTPRKYETHLAQRWAEGFRTGVSFICYPEVKKLGYTGSLTHLERLLSEWRRSGRGPCLASLDPDAGNRSSLAAMRVPPIAASYLCLKPRGLMTRQELATTTELKRAAPGVRDHTTTGDAISWDLAMAEIQTSLSHGWTMAHRSGVYGLRRFAYTIRNDLAAVRNAITERWSNGQTEGQINRLKTLKRQMYGRAGTELLRARSFRLFTVKRPTN